METCKKMESQKENKNLAFSICIQSFMPLIFVLMVVHFDFCLSENDNLRFWRNPFCFDVLMFLQKNIFLILIYTIYILLLLMGLRTSRKLSKVMKNQEKGGYSVTAINNHDKQSLNYFLTYLLPLVGDTPSNMKDFLSFIMLLGIIVYCVFKENLFFDNIILIHIFKYSIFDFICNETKEECIGITAGIIPGEENNIRFQRIYKNVYYVEVIKR